MAAFAPAPPHHLQHHQAPPTHHLQHPHSHAAQLFGAQAPPPPQGPPPSQQQQQQQGPPQPQDTTTHFDVQVSLHLIVVPFFDSSPPSLTEVVYIYIYIFFFLSLSLGRRRGIRLFCGTRQYAWGNITRLAFVRYQRAKNHRRLATQLLLFLDPVRDDFLANYQKVVPVLALTRVSIFWRGVINKSETYP